MAKLNVNDNWHWLCNNNNIWTLSNEKIHFNIVIIITIHGKMFHDVVKREAVVVAAPPDGKWAVHLTAIFGQLSCEKQGWFYFLRTHLWIRTVNASEKPTRCSLGGAYSFLLVFLFQDESDLHTWICANPNWLRVVNQSELHVQFDWLDSLFEAHSFVSDLICFSCNSQDIRISLHHSKFFSFLIGFFS